MTTDAIYEEHRSDWSHQFFAMATNRRLQCDQTLSLRRVWLARLEFAYMLLNLSLRVWKTKGWQLHVFIMTGRNIAEYRHMIVVDKT